jgi:hypothetical protein
MQHIDEYDFLCYKNKTRPNLFNHWERKQIVLFVNYEYFLHPGQTRKEKIIRNFITWPDLTQNIEYSLFMLHLSIVSNVKEGAKETWAAPTQNIKFDAIYLGHGVCESVRSIYNKDANHITLSTIMLVLTTINPPIKNSHKSSQRYSWIDQISERSWYYLRKTWISTIYAGLKKLHLDGYNATQISFPQVK